MVGTVFLIGTTAAVAVMFLGALVLGYRLTATPVTLVVDGQSATVHTHLATVADLLAEVELSLLPEDQLAPGRDAPLNPGMVVEVQRARPVHLSVLEADGLQKVLQTHAQTVAEVLDEAGVALGPADELMLEESEAVAETALPAPALGRSERTTLGPIKPWQLGRAAPIRVALRPAVPATVTEGDFTTTIWTTASTVGDALAREGWLFFEGDLVQPALGTPISAPLTITIERSLPVSIESVAGFHHTRTRRETVGDLLAEQSIVLAGMDRVEPPLDTPLDQNPELTVRVTRVEHTFAVEEEVTPYSSIWEPDSDMEIDTRGLDQEGVNGITRWRYRTILENGQPITTTLEDTWLAQAPITRVLNYGTKIVLREVETPDGPRPYWRKIRMFATSYAPDEAGVPVDSPYFGRTRLGTPVRRGIVAVDPGVVRLGSTVYVPGYGVASAQDTGGLIDGRWIDLAYDSAAQMEPWSRCVDVYVLGDPPPTYQIDYFLPNYPGVPCLRR